MAVDSKLVEMIKEGIRKRREGVDERFLAGAERVDIRHLGHLKLEATKGEFGFIVDEPPERGGTGEGPNPLAYFLAGAASCLMMQYARLAIAEGVSLEEFKVTARGHFDRRLSGAFHEIIYDVVISSREPGDVIKELVRRAEEMCFAHNTLKKAGVKMISNIHLNGRQIA